MTWPTGEKPSFLISPLPSIGWPSVLSTRPNKPRPTGTSQGYGQYIVLPYLPLNLRKGPLLPRNQQESRPAAIAIA